MGKIVAFESMLQISSSNNDDTRQQMLNIQNFQELKKTLQTASDNEDTNESEKVEKKELLASEDSTAKIKDSLPSPNMNSDESLQAESFDGINVDKLRKSEKGATTKLSKLNVWMKKQGKCFQCVSKQPLVIHLDEYESYKLVEK